MTGSHRSSDFAHGGGSSGSAHVSRGAGSSMQGMQIRISVSQLVCLWTVCGFLMFMVFLIGFYTGRKKGVNATLQEYSEQSVRLPIAETVANLDVATATSEESGADPKMVSQAAVALELGSPQEGKKLPAYSGGVAKTGEDVEDDSNFDFSTSKPLSQGSKLDSAVKDGPTAGLSSKPTLELFKSDGRSLNEQKKKKADTIGTGVGVVEGANNSISKIDLKGESAQKVPVKGSLKTVQKNELAKNVVPVSSSTGSKPEQTKRLAEGAKLPSGWYAQVAATLIEAEATAMQAKLKDKGLPSLIEAAKVKNQQYYRVLVGPFDEKKNAADGKEKVVKGKMVSGEPFLKFVR